MPTEIFAIHPLAHWDAVHPPLPRIRSVAADGWSKGRLAELLLQHDVIALPTADFSILPALLFWFGEDLLCDALGSGAIRFIRYFGSIAYHGDLKDFGPLEAWPEQERPPLDRSQRDAARERLAQYAEDGRKSYWSIAPMADTRGAARLYLTQVFDTRRGPISGASLDNMIRLIERQTIEVTLDRNEFQTEVITPTLADIEHTRTLREFVLEETGKSFLELSDIGNAEQLYRHFDLVFRDDESQFSEIDLVLWMAMANFELALAHRAESGHVLVGNPIRDALLGRARRTRKGPAAAEEFAKLLEVVNVPSIADAVANELIDLRQLWRLRDSESGVRFRRWFGDALASDQYENIRDAYLGSLSEPAPWITSAPVRILRFLAPSAVGLLNPLVGQALAAADFAGDFLPRPWTAKVFVDELRKIPRSDNAGITDK